MLNIELSWQQAAVAAAAAGGGAVALRLTGRRRLRGPAVLARESALVLGLFALWQLAGSFSVLGPGDALARSRWIWRFERAVYLPSEAALQRLFLPHPLLVQLCNLYYAGLHFPILIGCMIWLFARHRDSYRRLRTTLVLFTGASLLIQLIPVAPPRMLPQAHMVDTAVRYGQSVYAARAGFEADQLSAMPSVHVGWAILVAIAVIGSARTRWRWLALAYPVVTTVVVVVTANHFWLDAIVAAALLGLVLLAQRAVRQLRAAAPERARGRASQVRATPAAAAARRPVPQNPGLFPDGLIWDHSSNTNPVRNGDGDGRGNSAQRDDRAPAGRDRPA